MTQRNQPVTYAYSKISSCLITIFLLGIVGYSIPHLLQFIHADDVESYVLIAVFDLAFMIMALIVVIKYTIPSLRNQAALELNDEELVSYMRDVTIPWNDIADIQFKTGKSSASLYITFRSETDRGSHIRIPLAFVAGNDEDIYEAVKGYKK